LPSQVLSRLGNEISDEQKDGLLALLGMIGRKNAKAKEGGSDEAAVEGAESDADEAASDQTAHLLYLSRQEIDLVAQFALENKDKLAKVFKPGKKRATDAEALKKLRKEFGDYLAANTKRNAVDVGLFGRFLTSDELDTIDGALHVAHGIGTQKVDVDFDYFTAVDDLGDTSGAGHLGETELASSVLYLYACCDLSQLQTNVAERKDGERVIDQEAIDLAARSLGSIARAMACATPTGKRTGTAPYTPAEYLEVIVRRGMPLSFANAFTSPVKGKDGDVMDASIGKLVAHREKLETAFGRPDDVIARQVLSLREVGKGDKSSLIDLAKTLEEKIKSLGRIQV